MERTTIEIEKVQMDPVMAMLFIHEQMKILI